MPEQCITPCQSCSELQELKKDLQLQYEELKFTSQQLHDQSQYLRLLLRMVPDLIWAKTPQGVYTMCNQQFEKLFGTREPEIVGKTDFDFVDKTIAQQFVDNDKSVIAAGRSLTHEEVLTFATGGYVGIFETTRSPLYDHRGAIIGVVGVARDTTLRRELEKKLREETRINELHELGQLISPREMAVLKLLGTIKTSREIGERLFVSQKTIEAHRASIMRKLGVANTAGLAYWIALVK